MSSEKQIVNMPGKIMESVPVEQKLFGHSFELVEDAVGLLKECSGLVRDDAVVHAVQNDANWQNNDLEVVFNTRCIGIAGEEAWRDSVENQ